MSYPSHRSLLLLALLLLPLSASGTPLAPFIALDGQGLAVAAGGVGTEDLGAGTHHLSVAIGGPVHAAVLYWAGRDRPCDWNGTTCVTSSHDQELLFDGVPVVGTLIGTESQPASANGPIDNVAYLADVTALVAPLGPGLHSFAIADGNLGSDFTLRFDGVGLLVLYTDPTDPNWYRVLVYDGLDFAWGPDPTPGETRVIAPVTFAHGATPDPRVGRLDLFVGDATPVRPDRLDISNNPSVFNGFDESQGRAWDADTHAVSIPAGVAATTVQLFSEPNSQNPDSLLWVLGVLRVPLPVEEPPAEGDEGCTPGYWKNHTDSWAATGYSPGQTAGSVFSGASAFPSLAGKTLLQSLQGGGGPGTLGAAKILLRAAVAALLNAAHPDVDSPLTVSEIIADTNAALSSNSRSTMLSLASELDDENNLGCSLN